MTGSVFDGALRAAMARVTGEGIEFDQWAAVAIECDRALAAAGILDHTVRATAATARLVSAPVPNLMAAEFTAAQGRQPLAPSQVEGARLAGREALRFTTHAATRNVSGVRLAVLREIERELTSASASDGALEVAVTDWRVAVAACGRGERGPSAHLAASIAMNQVLLLTHVLRLLEQVEATSPETDVGRLRMGIEACREAWREARADLKFAAFGELPHDADSASTRQLAVAVGNRQTELANQQSAQLVLHELLRSGFAGNLVAGLVVGGALPDAAIPVIDAAARLEQIIDPLPEEPFRPAPAAAAPVQRAVSVQPPRPARPVVAMAAVQVGHGIDVEAVRLSPVVEKALGVRRDVGVLAQAALAGNPVAGRITAGVTEAELRSLAADGRRALAQMVVSVLPAAWGQHHRVMSFNKDEAMQSAVVDLLEAAARWDPAKSRWLTYGTAIAGWAARHWIRNETKNPLPVDSDLESRMIDRGPTLDEVAEQRQERRQATHLVEWIKRRGGGALSRDAAQVLLGYYGLDGKPSRPLRQVGAELGFSEGVARRHLKEGLERVREAAPLAGLAPAAAPGSRARAEQRRQMTPSRTSGPPR